MKFKKLLLFILLFFFCLILKNNVNADFTVTDIHDKNVTIPDLPIDSSLGYCYFHSGYNEMYNNLLYVITSSDNGYFYITNHPNSSSAAQGLKVIYSVGFTYSVYKYDTTNKIWNYQKTASNLGLVCFTKEGGDKEILYTSLPIYAGKDKSDIFFNPTPVPDFVFPYIANKDLDIAKGTNDYFLILPGSVPSYNDITFNIYLNEGEDLEVLYTTVLNSDSDFYKSVIVGSVLEFWYEVPVSSLDFGFDVNNKYIFNLSGVASEEYSISKEIIFKGMSQNDIYNGITDNINSKTDELKDALSEQTNQITTSIDKQTEVLEQQQETANEQLETSKGIWGTLKEVLSFINPFSENFFVYKLVDLLVNAIKSLFIPSDEFFNNYFNELMNWFSDRLGFLAYPLELILNVLNRIVNINFTEPIIQIPDFIEPSTNQKIISAQTYNLNSLLDNSIFKTCHDIYLIFVDAVIIFGLVNLLKNKLEEVFTK